MTVKVNGFEKSFWCAFWEELRGLSKIRNTGIEIIKILGIKGVEIILKTEKKMDELWAFFDGVENAIQYTATTSFLTISAMVYNVFAFFSS